MQQFTLTQDEHYPVNSDIIHSLELYLNHKRPVGGFLNAVLENNLTEAFARADSSNSANMKNIVGYVYNNLPYHAWGTKERVAAWMKGDAE